MLKSPVNMQPLILAIETSCDETAAAVVQGTQILGFETYSQMAKHAEFGGVVPSIAKLEHQLKIDGVIASALSRAEVSLAQIEAIAVTVGPGLAIALEVGVNKAKELALSLGKPLITVNHMLGHLFSPLASQEVDILKFPALGVLISGNHSEFVLLTDLKSKMKLGETLDDACGEAFDKFARLVGLPYPGGPEVSRITAVARPDYELTEKKSNGSLVLTARHLVTGKELSLPIPLAMTNEPNLSYSGLKTAVKNLVAAEIGVDSLQNVQDIAGLVKQKGIPVEAVQQLCVLFESAAFLQITKALDKIVKKHTDLQTIVLGGGVIANSYFREQMTNFATKHSIQLYIPTFELSTDNAGMIGVAASIQWQQAHQPGESLENCGIFTTSEQIALIDRNPSLQI